MGLKPDRCSSVKCAMVRKPYRPGIHGKKRQRGSGSEFKSQLQEKQRLRFTYGLRESALKRVVTNAMRAVGIKADIIMSALERRLDNVVYRLGFASSRSVARQLVSHGHISVNGRTVTIPSYSVRVNDVVSIRQQSREHPAFKDLAQTLEKTEAPVWFARDIQRIEGIVLSAPKDIILPFDINLIVDYYSK